MSQYREFIGQVVRALPDEAEMAGRMQPWIADLSALRMAIRRALLPLPIITITGIEELQFPDWVRKVEEDVTEPIGTIELEIIELLEPDEDHISGDEMRRRATAKRADLGLRHAQAFLAKYRQESFGLPPGTYLTFPGTVVVGGDGPRSVPDLLWDGGEWDLYWLWLEVGWYRGARLVRPRASR